MNPILNKMGANANEQKKLLMECVSMLEKYVNRFPAEKGCASFSGEDMKLWKEVYFSCCFEYIRSERRLGKKEGPCGLWICGSMTV